MEIIAEIGQNHNGDMELAKDLIAAAKESGADVAKFQVFDALSTFGKMNNPWFDYHCKTQLSADNVNFLADECKKNDIEFMASVFDIKLIGLLEDVSVKRYKIASRSIYDKKLIEVLLQINKPLIISLGHWKEKILPKFNSNSTIDYLYCISKYPTKISEINFNSIDFDAYSGFSDHTLGVSASIYAMLKGARIIEKHFTIDKNLYGPDQALSITPAELSILTQFKKDLIDLKK